MLGGLATEQHLATAERGDFVGPQRDKGSGHVVGGVDEDLDRHFTGLEIRRNTLKAEIDNADHVSTKLREVEELRERVDEYLGDLPDLLDRSTLVRSYETVPVEKTKENPLGVFILTPDRIRYLPREEVERRERKAKRSQGFRELYETLDLRVVAHKDHSLEVTWSSGQTNLRCPDLRGRG